jgi:hypothetical protein
LLFGQLEFSFGFSIVPQIAKRSFNLLFTVAHRYNVLHQTKDFTKFTKILQYRQLPFIPTHVPGDGEKHVDTLVLALKRGFQTGLPDGLFSNQKSKFG